MQARLSAADAGFLEAVEAFIAEAWSARVTRPGRTLAPPAGAREAWFAALAARGWAVPHWPVPHGGTGWSPRQLYLWRTALASAGAPRPASAAIDWAGPGIWRWGDAAQRARWLPGIRELREQWCLGVAEPVAEWQWQQVETEARKAAAGGTEYVIEGVKSWVADADAARWLLLLARTAAAGFAPDRALSLFVVDLEAPGVAVTPVTLLDGRTRVYRVVLAGVRVPAAHRLGAEGTGLGAMQALAAAAEREFEPAAGLARLAAALRAAAGELPGDVAERLADEPGFAQRLAELDVELAGLEAMEWRWLAGDVGAISRSRLLRRQPGPEGDLLEDRDLPEDRDREIAPTVLRLRRTAIAQRFGALCAEAFGYYSLPYPDPVTIDNEGPIGHHYALAALQGMLASRHLPIDGGTSEAHRDRIANQLFGL